MATPRAEQGIEPITLRFGFGLNTQVSDTVIGEQECASGRNFRLDLGNVEMRPRRPFDLRATCPGSGSIEGYAQLRKRDGTISTLIQRGTEVYIWDGSPSGFVNTGVAVAAGTKMRGKPREHGWSLTDVVLISDLALLNPVMQWNGTTLQNVDFKDGEGAAFGTLSCRYIYVSSERAYYANVLANGTTTEHLMAGSRLSDYEVVANTGSAVTGDDPFFVLTPDLKPINGSLGSFGLTMASTENGSMFRIDGADATDFSLTDLHSLTAVRGREALAYVGNDVAYGMQGRIELIAQGEAAFKFVSGNIGYHIEPSIADVDEWTIIYNRRRQLGYFFPGGQSRCWTFDRKINASDPSLSPWAPMETLHPMAFLPTCTWTMDCPETGLEEAFMGDTDGNIFQLEGTGAGDGGSYEVQSERTSRVLSIPVASEAYDVEGWIYYRKAAAPAEIRVGINWSGQNLFDDFAVVNIEALAGASYYGGPVYYGGPYYYGTAFKGRLERQGPIDLPGTSSDLQIKLSAEGTGDFQIERLVLRLNAAG